MNLLNDASISSLALSVVTCAFIAGNAVAGERTDRSVEFTAYLPIPQMLAVLSRVTLAVGACLLFWFANESVLRLTRSLPLAESATAETLRLMAATSVLVFGVAWLCSTILASSALSAASGIAAVVAVGCGNVLVWKLMEIPAKYFSHAYITTCIVVGTLCFFAGVIYYLCSWRTPA